MANRTSSRTKRAEVHVALLRGINVGGKHMLPMKQLAAMFTDAGCGDVQTYIQSGNVVFRAGPALARRVPALITAAIADRFGFDAPVMTRTAEDLRRVTRQNPFLRSGTDTAALHVAFLADEPARASVATLDPARGLPDEFVVRGREIYLRFPNGLARSRLTTAYFDSRLETTITVRNWRTVVALLELATGR